MKNKILLLFITCCLSLVALKASAADFLFSAQYSTIGIGEVVNIDIKLNSPEGVNAVEGVVSWPTGSFDFVDACECGSVISFWIEKMTPAKTGDSVTFS